ncbi:MAG: type II toxin-antitoxin system RelE/ParE family toxin [Pseudomonadota bacterium]
MVEIREYLDSDGQSPFAKWFDDLDIRAALKVNTYVTRIGQGNFSRVEGVGDGVYECKIDWGAGFRVYFGKDGDKLVILLGGGTKKRQSKDIERAKAFWQAYKKQKKES